METLKPCPFCGSPAELEHDSDHHGEWFNLGCSRHWGRVDPDEACIGGRLFYTEFEKDEANAIEAWNRRVDNATIAELVKALEDGLHAIDFAVTILNANGIKVEMNDPSPTMRAALLKARGETK